MRIVIVEDESSAARALSRAIKRVAARIDSVELDSVTIRPDIDSALNSLVDGVDLLFLDINLNGESGFELLRSGALDRCETIIVSAYPEFALEAFELGARDYLLKPVTDERLELAMSRIPSSSSGEAPPLKSLMIRSRSGYESAPVERIIAVLGADDYAEVVLDSGERKLVSRRMNFLQARLPPDFFRTHRAAIARLSRIKEIRCPAPGRYVAVVGEIGLEAPVSRSNLRRLKQLIEDGRVDEISD